ncbi:MAG: hypothetical protein ACLQVY_01630 [Limisphaerales bacterium]
MNSISSVSPPATEEALDALRLKLLRDSPPENGQNSKVSTDYVALQTELKSGNVAEAQTDFGRLERDTLMANLSSGTLPPSGPDSSAFVEQSPPNGSSAPLLDASA